MMYIEHFVLLAGAYNLGFFIELAEYFIFYFFKLLCVYKDEKQKIFYFTSTKTRNKKIFFFLRQSNKKSRGYKPRLIIQNVLYTSFMNSLLNIKNRVISYALSVTHGRFVVMISSD